MNSVGRLALSRLVFRPGRICSPGNFVINRTMSGSPYEGGNPTHSTGGIFKHPSGDPPPSQEEISQWVRKELGDNWRSHGYDEFNQKADRETHALFMFTTVSVGMVILSVIWAYQPDRTMADWATREAYLLLREREAAGVEPISRDLVDPEKVLAHLPPDEELKAAGVVINI